MEFLNTIWIFFQDQILGMKFLNLLIGDVLSVAGVDIGGRLGGSKIGRASCRERV